MKNEGNINEQFYNADYDFKLLLVIREVKGFTLPSY